jgi:glucose/arabinose dehydrogenase
MSRRETALLGAAGLLLAGCSTTQATAGAAGTPPSGDPSPSQSAVTQTTARPTTSTSAEATVIEVRLANGAVTPPPGRVRVPLRSRVVIRVTSDVADTVHVHGYDVEKAVGAGTTTDIAFVADLPGTFEVETHDSALVLMQLQAS